jgi:hypothetical protein
MAKQATKMLASDRKKLYLLGGLVGVLVLIVGVNYLMGSKKAAPAPPPTAKDGRVRNTERAGQGAGAAPDNVRVADAPEYGPIEELPLYAPPTGGDVAARRNIFDYPPPPIVKPPPPPPIVKPPPPTINLGSLSPSSAVAGTSKPITVTLQGSIFPSDSQVYFNGQPIQAERLSANAIRATIPPGLLAAPGAARVEVKSASQPQHLWSGPVTFQLTPSPDPNETFTYSGRVGAQAVITLKEPNKRPMLVTVGSTINGAVPWKILAINDKQVEMLDTRNDIRKTLGLAPKSR